MKVSTTHIFDRADSSPLVHISGEVRKHFGRLEATEIESDIPLIGSEREEAEDKLCEEARYHGHIPEEEPEACVYNRY